jgi:hypothetical protein
VTLDVDVAVADTVEVGVVVTVVEAGVWRQVQTEPTKALADFRRLLSWVSRASARAVMISRFLWRPVEIWRFATPVTVAVIVLNTVF